MQNPERDPYRHAHVMLDKGVKAIQWRKRVFSTHGSRVIGNPQANNNNNKKPLSLCLTLYIKNNSKSITDLCVKLYNYKTFRKNPRRESLGPRTRPRVLRLIYL